MCKSPGTRSTNVQRAPVHLPCAGVPSPAPSPACHMLRPIYGLQRAILLKTNHSSVLPWVEKYVVRDVHRLRRVKSL